MFPVIFDMFCITGKKLEIFNSIIFLVSINMVDYLFLFKKSTDIFLHYKSMFINIISFSKRVMRLIYAYISILFNYTTFIIMTYCIGTFYRTVFSTDMSISFKWFFTCKTWFVDMRKNCTTFARTKYSFIRRKVFKFDFTLFTSNYHQYLYYTRYIK